MVLGTIVNALAIVGGSIIGLIFGGRIPEKYNDTVMKSMGLAIILLGLLGGLKIQDQDVLLVLFSLAIGSLVGEYLCIEDHLESLGKWIERKMGKAEGGIAKGFVTASLLYCVGSMAIVGSLESGLVGNHQTLYTKAVLDGITSIAFTSTMGIGVMLSAVAVFVYQGLITMTASVMKVFLIDEVIRQMSVVGGLLILAIGLNMIEVKRLKVGNMLPGIFIPCVYYIGKLLYFKIF
ncbi:hypothetical protein HNQ80_003685 [Anaerosolibacter carboniphilus]|uniref:DUF554 domain-containing protein n=1 Tax=Anaerosolibacter carboniphilus TaxID=1417629 RepID=A0A841L338_9FIRM|nr:hypothetical protein [Anaerosolibacter carboniphilus]